MFMEQLTNQIMPSLLHGTELSLVSLYSLSQPRSCISRTPHRFIIVFTKFNQWIFSLTTKLKSISSHNLSLWFYSPLSRSLFVCVTCSLFLYFGINFCMYFPYIRFVIQGMPTPLACRLTLYNNVQWSPWYKTFSHNHTVERSVPFPVVRATQ
jgi:hypothetical protein